MAKKSKPKAKPKPKPKPAPKPVEPKLPAGGIRVYDPEGNEVGDVLISENGIALLERVGEITIHFHTPQTLRYKLGEHNFTFTLRKLDKHITTREGDRLRDYIRLQREIRAAMEERNAGSEAPH